MVLLGLELQLEETHFLKAQDSILQSLDLRKASEGVVPLEMAKAFQWMAWLSRVGQKNGLDDLYTADSIWE